ncbi:MAG: phage terminase small subunit P27 family [Pseudonocardiaceae bacterium]
MIIITNRALVPGREAAAEWRRVVPGLANLDLLKEEDRAVLTAYCECWSTFVAATRTVQREGLTIQAKQGTLAHPTVGIARNGLSLRRDTSKETGPHLSLRRDIPVGLWATRADRPGGPCPVSS